MSSEAVSLSKVGVASHLYISLLVMEVWFVLCGCQS